VNRLVGRLLGDALQERRNARFIGELAVRESLRRLARAVEVRVPAPPVAAPPDPVERVEQVAIRTTEPVSGYDLLSVPQAIELIETLDPRERDEVLRYESITRRRSAILALGTS
jgi:hypothetical protein